MAKHIRNIILIIVLIWILVFGVVAIYNLIKYSNPSDVQTVHQNINEETDEEIDYTDLLNTITTSTIKANVKIISESYDEIFLWEANNYTAQGSGVIIGLNKNDYYFVLTNCHVVAKIKNREMQRITVKDYKGNSYSATKYHESPDYDLAVIYFKKKIELKTLKIENKNLEVGDDVISLGQPKGQNNAITWGKVSNYNTITLKDTPTYKSNVKFKVMIHNAPGDSGSSGGAVISKNLKIAGITFAGIDTTSCAIPAVKIKEYLTKHYYA